MRLSDLSENSRIRRFIFGQNLEKKIPHFVQGITLIISKQSNSEIRYNNA